MDLINLKKTEIPRNVSYIFSSNEINNYSYTSCFGFVKGLKSGHMVFNRKGINSDEYFEILNDKWKMGLEWNENIVVLKFKDSNSFFNMTLLRFIFHPRYTRVAENIIRFKNDFNKYELLYYSHVFTKEYWSNQNFYYKSLGGYYSSMKIFMLNLIKFYRKKLNSNLNEIYSSPVYFDIFNKDKLLKYIKEDNFILFKKVLDRYLFAGSSLENKKYYCNCSPNSACRTRCYNNIPKPIINKVYEI